MDYGFTHAGTVFTPNGTQGVAPADNESRNRALEGSELLAWRERPDRFVAYYDEKTRTVSTWLGTTIGTITEHKVTRHNFGGRVIMLRAIGTNGARYYGRASYDWGNVIKLRKVRKS